ncbi:DUF7535 family protein [Halobaculum sp. EA56]|uniref:DUF7535 family protein n=1 Tax=Halobaculum sp. EA56 TaxID=3421648 RepID=UPI003EB9C2BA
MSTEIDTQDGGDDPGLVTKAYRTVTPGYTSHGDDEMNAIGWAVFLGMLVLLFPLLPFVVVVWGVSKVIEAVTGDTGSQE